MTKEFYPVEDLKVEGRTGTWYCIDHTIIGGQVYLLMESEQHGDEADHIVITTEGEEVCEDLSHNIKETADWY